MMATQETSDLIGARVPTQEECDLIYRWMKRYYSVGMKAQLFLFFLLSFIGIILLLYSLIERQKETWGYYMAIGGAIILFALFILRGVKKTQYKQSVFEHGNYVVFDGSVCEMGYLIDRVGVMKVYFKARSGQMLDKPFEARMEELENGTPLLLICVKKEDIREKHDYERVFTPFMLTEKGIKINM